MFVAMPGIAAIAYLPGRFVGLSTNYAVIASTVLPAIIAAGAAFAGVRFRFPSKAEEDECAAEAVSTAKDDAVSCSGILKFIGIQRPAFARMTYAGTRNGLDARQSEEATRRRDLEHKREDTVELNLKLRRTFLGGCSEPEISISSCREEALGLLPLPSEAFCGTEPPIDRFDINEHQKCCTDIAETGDDGPACLSFTTPRCPSASINGAGRRRLATWTAPGSACKPRGIPGSSVPYPIRGQPRGLVRRDAVQRQRRSPS